MEPSAKRARLHNTDRLSALPDSLVYDIFSFLKSRQLVQASVLSRRWRHLWRSAPTIDIDQFEFCVSHDHCTGRLPWERFRGFTSSLISLHDAPCLDKFRLRVHHHDGDQGPNLRRWIAGGIQRSPAELDVYVDSRHGRLPLPSLGSGSSRLARLSLCLLTLDGGFAEQLRSGCPALQRLSLRQCDLQFREIASGTLRHLDVHACKGLLSIVAAPRLASLDIDIHNGSYPDGISVTEVSSIVKASIYVSRRVPVNAGFLISIRRLLNVKHLELSGPDAMAMLRQGSQFGAKFQKLRTLLLKECDLYMDDNMETLKNFLQNAPGFEKLIMHFCQFSDQRKVKLLTITEWRKICLRWKDLFSFKYENLKVIEIKYHKYDCVPEMVFDSSLALSGNSEKITLTLIKE